ncbi:MAG TPA: threonine/serine dehydratase [Acidimicrobiia bacterium]|nr:threonine/serine dehydratase [Acidimicrobiia bacterium]
MIPLTEIESARRTIAPYVVETPVATSRTLTRELGMDVSLKLELFQKTGSFKPRGAVNQLLAYENRAAGVVGISGGNFAQGLAYAAGRLGVPALIVMPETTPANYLEATRGYGAQVELAPSIADAFIRYEELVGEGWGPMHPFDDPSMMAGNGTLGIELLDQVPEATDVIVSIGGGGFMAGVTSAIKGLRPDVRVWGVETEGANVMARSLQAGSPQTMTPTSIAKTLGSPYAGEVPFEIARDRLEDVIVVSDAEAVQAMAFLFERAKLVTEPAAACTLAAARRLRDRLRADGTLVLVLCGGNLSVADLCTYTDRFG